MANVNSLRGEERRERGEEGGRGERENGRQGGREVIKELLTLTLQHIWVMERNTYLHTGVHEICCRTNVYKLVFLLLQDDVMGRSKVIQLSH